MDKSQIAGLICLIILILLQIKIIILIKKSEVNDPDVLLAREKAKLQMEYNKIELAEAKAKEEERLAEQARLRELDRLEEEKLEQEAREILD